MALRVAARATNVIEQFFDWALERPSFQRLALDAEAGALDHARAFSAVAQAGRFFLLPRSEDDSGAT